MGRCLNDKLPRVTIPSERITEAHWQQLLRERDARGKLRQKEYEYSDIGEGDHILLNKSRDNKLSPNFEPLPYKVVEKKGNSPLSHGGHIVPGDQKSFVLARLASPPRF